MPWRREILTALLLVVVATPADAQRDTLCRDRPGTEAAIQIASTQEPGTRLVITGRVLRGEARSPVAKARLLAFHTDAEGYYSVDGMDEQNARLCGVLLTDADGGYRIETIRPAHYATGGPPAHVHFELTVPGGLMRRFDLHFEGDEKLHGRSAGESWETIRPLLEHDNVLLVERDFWIR